MLHRHHEKQPCQACGAKVPTLRRGRCPVCYLRWSQSRPVGLGARCVVCDERRHDHLKMVEFQQRWLPMCHTCAGRGFSLTPLPETLEEFRDRLSRNRRACDRRIGRPDRRVFQIDRRLVERRLGATSWADEWLDASDLVIETLDDRLEGEATRIAQMPVS